MRDDSGRWHAPATLEYSSSDLIVTEVVLPAQHWVSGTTVLTQYKDQSVSWPDIVEADSYALILRRDRILLVGETDLAPGLSTETGLAVSDVTDAYQVIDISGEAAFDRLCHGAELDLNKPSASVMRRAFGADVLLYRVGTKNRYRMHVSRSLAQSVFQQLVS